jgi:dTDP-4-dehydrorhamnose 3,5-epimerase-like enzyme
MHFHKQKDETWYLLTGKLLLNWIDTIDASQHEDSFDSGQAIHIPPLMPHQLEALEDSVVLEVSTQHFDHDSYRIALGTAANPVDLEHDGIYTVAHMEKRMRELLK